MSRMNAKKRRRIKFRRYITNAALFTVMLLVATVIVGVDSEPAWTGDNGWIVRYDVRAEPPKIAAATMADNAEKLSAVPAPVRKPQIMAVIVLDGNIIGAVQTKEDARWVLEGLLAYYTEMHPDEIGIAYLKEPAVLQVLQSDEMVSPQELYLTLRNAMETAAVSAVPEVAEGEEAVVDTAALAASPLCITSTRVETLNEIAVYETETIEDNKMVRGAQNVHIDGRNGERIVTYEYNYVNGVKVSELVLEEIIVAEPINKVLRVGTKRPYVRLGNDGTAISLRYPCSGRISSYYGMRRDRMHYGIDIIASTGTPLKAAAGGVVTYAGERGNYGLLVEIDHGNGFVTRYGHCSKILVGVGERVSNGEVVAKVGNTGNSATPHVHFELRLNGSAVDPLPHL